MEQKTFAKMLKLIVIGAGICGLFIYLYILPSYVYYFADECHPGSANAYYWPWMIFLWMTAIPCYMVLVFGWKIAANIGNDKSFSRENASLMKWIAWMAAGDSVFLFAGNILFLGLNMNHPGIVLIVLVIVFAGAAITVVAAALSHLIYKAAVMQEESELTI